MKNIEKLIDAVAFIISQNDNKMNYTKMIKELYLCDKESFKQIGFSISGDSYVSMPQGPVLSTLYSLIKNKCVNEFQNKWNANFTIDNYDITVKDSYKSYMQLSKFEKRTMTRISNMYKEKDWTYLVDNVVHNPVICPEWDSSVVEYSTSKRISLKSIFKSLGFSKEQIKIAIEENKYYGM